VRIVAGDHRGRTLFVPDGSHVRPTSDRVREALFNILEHSIRPPRGAKVLDLFAGSGALGLEALSRGAEFVLFVDDHADSRAAVRRNIEALGATGHTKLYRRDATKLGPLPKGVPGPFNLVFLDPPYDKGLVPLAVASATEGKWLSPNALLVIECGANETLELDGFKIVDQRVYGDTSLYLATAK
jgi:16S rRNA (guanine966-N2)-methyltransferase